MINLLQMLVGVAGYTSGLAGIVWLTVLFAIVSLLIFLRHRLYNRIAGGFCLVLGSSFFSGFYFPLMCEAFCLFTILSCLYNYLPLFPLLIKAIMMSKKEKISFNTCFKIVAEEDEQRFLDKLKQEAYRKYNIKNDHQENS